MLELYSILRHDTTTWYCIFDLIEFSEISGRFVKDQKADVIAIFYDIGGIVGECNQNNDLAHMRKG